MVETEELTLSWFTEGIVLPDMYQLNIECSYIWEDEMLFSFTVEVNSNTTAVTIANVRPAVIFNFVLFAIYNPASFDEGLSLTVHVAFDRKGVTLPSIQSFIKHSYFYLITHFMANLL